jgi:hypothetical protein
VNRKQKLQEIKTLANKKKQAPTFDFYKQLTKDEQKFLDEIEKKIFTEPKKKIGERTIALENIKALTIDEVEQLGAIFHKLELLKLNV